MYCGIDFGTSNSSVALARDGEVQILEADPRNDSPASLPSLLYITRDGDFIIGRAAADAFIERNVGREVILKKVDLGISIEGYVGAEPDKSEGYRPGQGDRQDASEAVRAHALVETNAPGRLFQSLKSSLRATAFTGTEVFGQNYLLEELTAAILAQLRDRASAAAGAPVERAVFGRPVRFSTRQVEDDTAEKRLRRAAELAGFKEVVFFYEPVAACVEYAIRTDRKQRLMVVDIGGGTCDVCVMEFGGAAEQAARLTESQILGVSGVPVAGDAIDREITRAKLFPRFGSRARYGPNRLPMPQRFLNAITDWQNLYKLNTEENINWLTAIIGNSTDPGAIRALRTLIQKNYGYLVAREVEAAKKRLSFELSTDIDLELGDMHIDEPLQRSEFSHIIEYELANMHDTITEAEHAAGLKPQDIDAVLTTGGTSLVPAVRAMLEERFGPDRLLARDTFTSVASGLALVAQYA